MPIGGSVFTPIGDVSGKWTCSPTDGRSSELKLEDADPWTNISAAYIVMQVHFDFRELKPSKSSNTCCG